MKVSGKRGEFVTDIRHTQGVEMHFQQKHSMEVASECEQRQPGDSPRRRDSRPSGVLFQQWEEKT